MSQVPDLKELWENHGDGEENLKDLPSSFEMTQQGYRAMVGCLCSVFD